MLLKQGETGKAATRITEAERAVRAALERQPDTMALRVEMAAISALRQDAAAALEWLGRAYDGGYREYDFLELDPILRRQLGRDARFVAFIDRIRRDVAAQRERARQRRLLDVTTVLGSPQ